MAQDGMDFELNGEPLPTSFDVRHARPEATRTQPIRNWNGIFASPGEPPAPVAEAAEPRPESARQGVAAGYRVIDEYLRQGRKAARDFWSPSSAQSQAADGAHEPTAAEPQASATPTPDVSKLGERWLRSLGEFGINWLELMQAMSRPAETPRAAGDDDDDTSAGPFAVGHQETSRPAAAQSASQTSAASLPRMAFAISSLKPIEVRVNLDPSAWDFELEVAPLGDVGGLFPTIRGVKAVVSTDPVIRERCLRLEAVIPAEQPSGTYYGVVLAAGQARPVGTLTFCLS